MGRRLPKTARTEIVASAKEAIVLKTYASMDKEIVTELERIRAESGTVPSCKKGCYACCRQRVPSCIPEAAVMGRYIRKHFTPEQISSLLIRTREWFRWMHEDLPKFVAEGIDEDKACYNHGPYCPLLVEGLCSVYPVRPVACRAHFSVSDPRSCLPSSDPNSLPKEPELLYSVNYRTQPFAMNIRHLVESSGLDFTATTMLIPRWIAVVMGWEDLYRTDGVKRRE